MKKILALILFCSSVSLAGDYIFRANPIPDSSHYRTLGSADKIYKGLYVDTAYGKVKFMDYPSFYRGIIVGQEGSYDGVIRFDKANSKRGYLSSNTLTGFRTWKFPDTSGTVALLDSVTSIVKASHDDLMTVIAGITISDTSVALFALRVDSLQSSVNSMGSTLIANSDKLALMVFDTTFNYWGNADNSKIASLKLTADSIRFMVSKTAYDPWHDSVVTWKSSITATVNGLTLAVDGIKDSSWITLTATKIAQHADTVTIDGYVPSIISGWINANYISAKRISGDTLTGVVIEGVDIIGSSLSTSLTGSRALLNSGSLTFYASSDGLETGSSISAIAGAFPHSTRVSISTALTVTNDIYAGGDITSGGSYYGSWAGGAIGDSYISSASTWNAKLSTETDPTIYAWAKASTKPTYAYDDLTTKPTSSQLQTILSGVYAAAGHGHDLEDLSAANTGQLPSGNFLMLSGSNGLGISSYSASSFAPSDGIPFSALGTGCSIHTLNIGGVNYDVIVQD